MYKSIYMWLQLKETSEPLTPNVTGTNYWLVPRKQKSKSRRNNYKNIQIGYRQLVLKGV